MKNRVISLLMIIAMLLSMTVVHAEDDLAVVTPNDGVEAIVFDEAPSLAGDEFVIDAELPDVDLSEDGTIFLSELGDLVVNGEEPAVQEEEPVAMFYAVAADGDVTVYADASKAETLGVLAMNSVVLVVEKVDEAISHVAFAKDEAVVEG
ncbi:MAG: hypothetical protein IJT26_01605, partial [Bacteroidales bacterium]|nr:hypothetical protein [Bacteroidales bacterium]